MIRYEILNDHTNILDYESINVQNKMMNLMRRKMNRACKQL